MAITPSQWSHVLTIPESYTPSAATSGQTLVITEGVITKLSAGDQATFWSNVQNGGGDVRICTDSAGTNQLPVEVVSLDNVAQTCVIWTRKSTYAGTGELYLFIGKAGETQPAVTDPFGRNAVWVDFEYMFHFDSSGELVDSSGAYSLSEFGVVSSIAGKVGGGADAQRDNANYHEVSGYAGVSGGAARTHSMWFKSNSNAGFLEYGTSATAQRYTVRLDGGRFRTEIAGSFTRTNNTGFADNAWHMAVTKENGSGTFPSGNKLIVDGSVQGVNTGSNIALNTTPAVNLTFNNVFAINSNSQYDEYGLRLFETTDATDATEYANQNDPATFYGTPTIQTTGGSGAVTAGVTEISTDAVESSSISISANITAQVTELNSNAAESSSALFTTTVSVSVTELSDNAGESSAVTITNQLVTANVTELSADFSESATASFSGSLSAIVTELAQNAAESSSVDISANISVAVTELAQDFADNANVNLVGSFTVDVTETTTDFDEACYVQLPVQRLTPRKTISVNARRSGRISVNAKRSQTIKVR